MTGIEVPGIRDRLPVVGLGDQRDRLDACGLVWHGWVGDRLSKAAGCAQPHLKSTNHR